MKNWKEIQKQFQYYAELKELNESDIKFLTDLLGRQLKQILEEMVGEERPVNWQNIGSPGLIAQQSESYGYNWHRDEMLSKIEKFFE